MTFDPDCVAARELCRIVAAAEDGHAVTVLTQAGSTLTFTGDDLGAYSPGDSAVLGSYEARSFLLATDLPFEPAEWVGVVKHVAGEETICEVGGRFAIINRGGIECEIGNTVIGDATNTLLRVVTHKPLKYIEFPSDEDLDVSRFRGKPADLSFEDFGGYPTVVARARELIETPINKGHLLNSIGARSIRGVIFSGPPGTGKTLLAKIIAASTDSHYYEISGPEIMSKWFGDAEAMLREIFMDAQRNAPSIIVIDEIDSIAGQRRDDSHEASKRVVAQMLTLMDGLRGSNATVIATTNRVHDLDQALRRPGRFDWEVEFTSPTLTDRVEILRTSSRRLSLHEPLNHWSMAGRTEGWSAAELTLIWSEAALLAAQDNRGSIAEEDYFGGYWRVESNRKNKRK